MAAPYRLQAHVVVHAAVGEANVLQVTFSLRTLRKSSYLREPDARSDKHGLEDWRKGRRRCDRLSDSNIPGLTVTSFVVSHAFPLKHPIYSEDHIRRAENKAGSFRQFSQL